jgi:hypothetical protein
LHQPEPRIGGPHQCSNDPDGAVDVQNHKMSPDSYYHVVYGPMFAPTDNSAIPDREQISFHSPSATAVLRDLGKPYRGNPKLWP